MEHELPFRVATTLVIKLVLLHSHLPIDLALLEACANRRLPLVLYVASHHNILVLTLHTLCSIIYLYRSLLPPLRSVLARLAITSLLLGHP